MRVEPVYEKISEDAKKKKKILEENAPFRGARKEQEKTPKHSNKNLWKERIEQQCLVLVLSFKELRDGTLEMLRRLEKPIVSTDVTSGFFVFLSQSKISRSIGTEVEKR